MKTKLYLLFVSVLLLSCSPAEVETQPTTTFTQTAVPTRTPASTLIPTITRTPTGALVSSGHASQNTPTAQATESANLETNEVTATVTRIIDGDTIEVMIGGTSYRVRYIGMDTPERGDPFYEEATEANRQLVEEQTVTLVKDVSETDRYGRLLRYVYLPDGTFVNAELVKQGYAQVATFPPDVKYQELFVQLQTEARNAGLGIWGLATLIPPTNTPLPINTPLPTHTPQPTNPPQSSSTPQPTNPPLPTNTPLPLPTATLPPANCDPSYPTVCIPPPPPDLDCGGIPYRDFQVLEPDPHGFDRDNDGIGCES